MKNGRIWNADGRQDSCADGDGLTSSEIRPLASSHPNEVSFGHFLIRFVKVFPPRDPVSGFTGAWLNVS